MNWRYLTGISFLGLFLGVPFFAVYLFFDVYPGNPPGIYDPRRQELGVFLYTLLWAVNWAPLVFILCLSGALERFYLFLPLLIGSNWLLIRCASFVHSRWKRRVLIVVASGVVFATILFLGLRLGLWERQHFT